MHRFFILEVFLLVKLVSRVGATVFSSIYDTFLPPRGVGGHFWSHELEARTMTMLRIQLLGALVLLSLQPVRGSDSHDHDHSTHGSTHTGSATADTSHACFSDPTKAECADARPFYGPLAVNEDLKMLCTNMKYMSGCSVRAACQSKTEKGDYCVEMSLLSNICSTTHGENMAGMGGCANYNKLCKTGTKVSGCDSGIKGLIPTAKMVSDVAAACTTVGSADPKCTEKCKSSSPTTVRSECTDPLDTLSAVCRRAPSSDSAACANWKKMCSDATPPPAAYCSSASASTSGIRPFALTLLLVMTVLIQTLR